MLGIDVLRFACLGLALLAFASGGTGAEPTAPWTTVSTTERPTASPALKHYRIIVRHGPTDKQATLDAVIWEDHSLRLTVADQPAEPRLRLAAVATAQGALAGVNGGYFHPDYRPSGLVISEGKRHAPAQKAALLSGAVVAREDGQVRILRYSELDPDAGWFAALQAGPFLVDQSKAVSGLNAERPARRTIIASDGKRTHAFLVTSPLTLAETAELLATLQPLPGLQIQRALNLDGGSSTAFWVAQPGSSAYSQSEWSPVRNLFLLLPK